MECLDERPKIDTKKVGGRCMRVSDGKLCFSEKKRGKVWKDYLERIMNEENDRDHNVEGYAVKSPAVCVNRMEAVEALNEMKTGKAPKPSHTSLKMVAASSAVGIQVMAKICQKV